jgi:hypothetical protein
MVKRLRVVFSPAADAAYEYPVPEPGTRGTSPRPVTKLEPPPADDSRRR